MKRGCLDCGNETSRENKSGYCWMCWAKHNAYRGKDHTYDKQRNPNQTSYVAALIRLVDRGTTWQGEMEEKGIVVSVVRRRVRRRSVQFVMRRTRSRPDSGPGTAGADTRSSES